MMWLTVLGLTIGLLFLAAICSLYLTYGETRSKFESELAAERGLADETRRLAKRSAKFSRASRLCDCAIVALLVLLVVCICAAG